ncbi:MAG: large subunit ribosomal protein L18 [Candidatus Saccharimonadales bacterium]|jgi:large subunit ribosomal protein L18
MSELKNKALNAIQRASRTRSNIRGTKDRPRLSVNISNKNISAQIINDEDGTTLVATSTIGVKATGTMTEKAAAVGAEIAKNAKTKKIKLVAFDRGSKKYHGRIKALADAARENGLEF